MVSKQAYKPAQTHKLAMRLWRGISSTASTATRLASASSRFAPSSQGLPISLSPRTQAIRASTTMAGASRSAVAINQPRAMRSHSSASAMAMAGMAGIR